MSLDLEITQKLSPLFEILDGKHPNVDTVIITGGRLGTKSFGTSLFACEAMVQHDWQIMFTRFANVSNEDSTIPELEEKVSLLGYDDSVRKANNRFISECGDGKIVFKGLKASQATQSANLKSLKGFNCWINDESEEIPDYETFEKIYLSIRSNEKQNVTILILNPTIKDFWIHDRFFKPNDIPNLFNGIVDNVMYIHTTYLDVPNGIIPDNILRKYENMRIKYPDEYEHVVLGGWLANLEGVVFKKEEFDYFALSDLNIDNIQTRIGAVDVADEGTDSLSLPIGYKIGKRIFVTDWLFTTENTDYTIPATLGKINKHRLNYLAIETNNHGSVFNKQIINSSSGGCRVIPINQRSNKHGRIIQFAGFVRDFFVFRNDVEPDSDYAKAMKEFFNYTKDGKAKHDDAPDSIVLMAAVIQDLFPHEWYQ